MDKKYIILPNKERIAYLEQGKGDNYLILIHGNFSSSLHFSTLIEQLPKDVHIIAPDLRGYGDSSYYNGIDTLADFAEDVFLLTKALKIKKANVLGWSLGGGVAMALAANHNDFVSKLILVASTIYTGYPIFKKNEAGQPLVGQVYQTKEEMACDPVQVLPVLNMQKNKDFNMLSYIFDVTIYTGKNKPSKENNELWINESLKQVNLIDADFALATFNISDSDSFYGKGDGSIKNINMPVLILAGAKDITVPNYMTDANHQVLKKNASLKIYAESGHSPFVDCLEEIVDDIEEFIK